MEMNIGIWLKSFFGLPFLPVKKVEEGILELMSTCPKENEGYIFSDYIYNISLGNITI